ncbi:MAG: kelch repeat-containing protein, partial [Thermoleophilaceae bacterium]
MSAATHTRFLELAAASVDFELSREERAELEGHLEACRTCFRALHAIEGDGRTIRALPVRALAVDRAPVILSRALRRSPDLSSLRLVAVAALLALLAVALVTAGSELVRREAPALRDPRPTGLAPSPPQIGWQTVARMSVARGGHTATMLPDGRVLVAGGGNLDMLRSSEIFDPGTGDWNLAGEMFEVRSGHVAVALPDGEVLVISGFTDGGLSFTSERFSGGSWSPGPDLINARVDFTAVVAGRRVVVIGGSFADGVPRSEVEVWDFDGPLEFVEAASLTTPRNDHTATALPDGRIVVIGGRVSEAPLASVELFDPSSGAWRTAGTMTVARYDHAATLLNDGRILVTGGRGTSAEVLT